MTVIIPIKQLIRATNTRRTQFVMRPIEPSSAQTKELERLYVTVPNYWIAATGPIMEEYRKTIATMTFDSPASVNARISEAANGAVQAVLNFGSLFGVWLTRANRTHYQKFIAALKYATNVDLKTIFTIGTTEATLESVLERNIGLIRNVSDATRAKISDAVFRGLQNQTPARDVAKEITRITGIEKKRALRIASDQAVKLSSQLDRERQTQLGMDSFKWNHSDKVNYRPEHKARDGKVYKWTSHVAKTDPPGFLPFCGCKAQGFINLGNSDD